jgi:hypothetical protein
MNKLPIIIHTKYLVGTQNRVYTIYDETKVGWPFPLKHLRIAMNFFSISNIKIEDLTRLK